MKDEEYQRELEEAERLQRQKLVGEGDMELLQEFSIHEGICRIYKFEFINLESSGRLFLNTEFVVSRASITYEPEGAMEPHISTTIYKYKDFAKSVIGKEICAIKYIGQYKKHRLIITCEFNIKRLIVVYDANKFDNGIQHLIFRYFT